MDIKRALFAGLLGSLAVFTIGVLSAGSASATIVRSGDAACKAAASDPRGVLVIGDSITMNGSQLIVDDLSDAGYVVCLDAKSGRKTNEGIAVLRGFVRQGVLPPRVVLALGTNDVTTPEASMRASVKEAQALTAGRRLIWINAHRETNAREIGHLAKVDAILKQADAGSRWFSVVDWQAYVIAMAGAGLMRDDGIHLTPAGDVDRTELLLDRLRTPVDRLTDQP